MFIFRSPRWLSSEMKNSIQWICFVYDSYNRCSFTQRSTTAPNYNNHFNDPLFITVSLLHCRTNKFFINKKIVTSLSRFFYLPFWTGNSSIVLLDPHVLISMKFHWRTARQAQVGGAINVCHFASFVKYYLEKFLFFFALSNHSRRHRRGFAGTWCKIFVLINYLYSMRRLWGVAVGDAFDSHR